MPEQPLSPAAVRATRPTVRVEGADEHRVSALVQAMELTESEGGLTALELRLSNVASLPRGAELAFDDETFLRLGAALVVGGGDANGPVELFRGVVTGLEAEYLGPDGPPELTVLAEDALQGARMARRTAVYTDVSPADLARQVAGRLGLDADVLGLTEPVATWAQLNESDLAFLRRVLARQDADLQVVADVLRVFPRAEAARGTVELRLPGQLRRVRALADLAHQVTEVTVSGWDPAAGARVRVSSTGTEPRPATGFTGPQRLRATLGPRTEHVGDVVAASDAEARALADAAFDRRARRFATVSATAEGNPLLRVGTRVRFRGLSVRFDNTYYVVRAVHRWDVERGYETDFEAECAIVGAA
jgi:phage protein D